MIRSRTNRHGLREAFLYAFNLLELDGHDLRDESYHVRQAAFNKLRDPAEATRRGFHSALFSALLAFALFDPESASAQEMKQIKLTEKYIQDFMAAAKDIANLNDDANPDQPEAIAKRNGFASLAKYEDVGMNISII